MLYDYLALLFFLAFAVLVPVLFVVTSRLIAKKVPGNAVKNSPYESGEETIGSSRDIDNEYLPYFMIFLPFELILGILILWSTVAKSVSYEISLSVVFLGVFGSILSYIGYKMASG